ncbi:MAG: heme lyase CcmF/NrfE family subunit [Planctomycetes bacterium]|nr:heme lyase CcmF/NrfE family subunit [Planctomycetota bacterium]NOG54131.1 heme lyase CcmF/NrfE family subunit [Planctomycetota bacterium]
MISLIDTHLPALGTYLLYASFLVSLMAALLSLLRLTQPAALSVIPAKWCTVLYVILISAACALLLRAELINDFRLEYVASYNETALPVGYKIAAFWAGQSGSLLLWAEMMAVMGLIAVLTHWNRHDGYMAGTIATIAVSCCFFTALIVFTSVGNPFTLVEGMTPRDGNGLNPMLQDPAMIAHPPFLFLGYAGCLLPYAFTMGALVSGRTDNQWLADIRRWTLAAWLFLTVGIVLGSWWAYVELGWGGYWAWDPVENASLLPWLTITAVLHSIMVQQRRGMFKRWNVALISMSFFLCIVGTYITRSGVIDSVHAFPDSPVGRFFFFFLIGSVLITMALGVFRFNRLRSEHPMLSVVGTEAAFMATNVLLVIIMLATLVGTMWPVISSTFSRIFLGNEHQMTLQQSFYNKQVLPFAMVLFGLMSLGPLFVYGRNAADQMRKTILIPIIVGACCGLVAIVLHFLSDEPPLMGIWTLCAAAVAGTAMLSIVTDFVRSVRLRREATGQGWPMAAVTMIDTSHRRYGGQLVHVGVIMLLVGIVGSSIYKQEQKLTLQEGQSSELAGYTFAFNGLDITEGPNYEAVIADMTVTSPGNETFTLSPEYRKYNTWEEMNREISVRIGLGRDVYLTLEGWEAGGKVVSFTAYVTPLITWLWIGTIVMCIGGTFAMLPRFLPVGIGTSSIPRYTPGDSMSDAITKPQPPSTNNDLQAQPDAARQNVPSEPAPSGATPATAASDSVSS